MKLGAHVNDLLHLVIIKAYVSRLMQNVGVVRYLNQNHTEALRKLLLIAAGHGG
jgi:hypothetical protein